MALQPDSTRDDSRPETPSERRIAGASVTVARSTRALRRATLSDPSLLVVDVTDLSVSPARALDWATTMTEGTHVLALTDGEIGLDRTEASVDGHLSKPLAADDLAAAVAAIERRETYRALLAALQDCVWERQRAREAGDEHRLAGVAECQRRLEDDLDRARSQLSRADFTRLFADGFE
jgi:DNA-binding response OmpR family regulator